MICVYAITGRAYLPRLSGIRNEPVHAIRSGALTAVVGDLRRVPAATPANLRRYHATVAKIAAVVPAVLPARFGTVMSEEELRFVLRSRAATLAAALKHVRGRVQMTLRTVTVRRSAAAPPGKVVLPSNVAASGAGYLRARAAAAADQREAAELAPVRAAVSRWLRDERVERRADVVSAYHLVPRAAAAAYTRAARAAAAAAGIGAAVSGPFPPYAFTVL